MHAQSSSQATRSICLGQTELHSVPSLAALELCHTLASPGSVLHITQVLKWLKRAPCAVHIPEQALCVAQAGWSRHHVQSSCCSG